MSASAPGGRARSGGGWADISENEMHSGGDDGGGWGGGGAATRRQEAHAMLLAYYRFYDPSKIGTIDDALFAYHGRYDEMQRRLEELYGPRPSVALHSSGGRGGPTLAANANVQRRSPSPQAARPIVECVQSAGAGDVRAADDDEGELTDEDDSDSDGALCVDVARRRLLSIYLEHAPLKAHEVDGLLLAYQGREREAIQYAAKHLGPEPDMEARKLRLLRFYEYHCPAKVVHCDEVLYAYSGDENALFAALVQKYGPEPAPDDASPHDTTRRRLTAFIAAHCPTKISALEDMLLTFGPDHRGLFRALTAKYGPEPIAAPQRGGGGGTPSVSLAPAPKGVESDPSVSGFDAWRRQLELRPDRGDGDDAEDAEDAQQQEMMQEKRRSLRRETREAARRAVADAAGGRSQFKNNTVHSDGVPGGGADGNRAARSAVAPGGYLPSAGGPPMVQLAPGTAQAAGIKAGAVMVGEDGEAEEVVDIAASSSDSAVSFGASSSGDGQGRGMSPEFAWEADGSPSRTRSGKRSKSNRAANALGPFPYRAHLYSLGVKVKRPLEREVGVDFAAVVTLVDWCMRTSTIADTIDGVQLPKRPSRDDKRAFAYLTELREVDRLETRGRLAIQHQRAAAFSDSALRFNAEATCIYVASALPEVFRTEDILRREAASEEAFHREAVEAGFRHEASLIQAAHDPVRVNALWKAFVSGVEAAAPNAPPEASPTNKKPWLYIRSNTPAAVSRRKAVRAAERAASPSPPRRPTTPRRTGSFISPKTSKATTTTGAAGTRTPTKSSTRPADSKTPPRTTSSMKPRPKSTGINASPHAFEMTGVAGFFTEGLGSDGDNSSDEGDASSPVATSRSAAADTPTGPSHKPASTPSKLKLHNDRRMAAAAKAAKGCVYGSPAAGTPQPQRRPATAASFPSPSPRVRRVVQ